MSRVKNPQLSALLEQEIVAGRVARAGVAGWARDVGAVATEVGAAGRLPGDRAVGVDTIFDLASVSKPVVACTFARVAARRGIAWQTPLGALLPLARGTQSEHVALELLLSHRAGLEAHRSLFAPVFCGRALRRQAALHTAAQARRAECVGVPPLAGFEPVYSDLGYILLGAALEAVSGEPLDTLIEREVATPLGLSLGSVRKLMRRGPEFARDVAPTEIVRARGGCIRGVVHDENAWALSGHASSGHAGLFGTASDVLGFGVALLQALSGRSEWLGQAELERLVRVRPGGTLRAGFDGKSPGASAAGAACGPETFGHLGFTGTSLWCDPAAGVATVLLTNRVHPTRDNPRIRAARPRVHDALFAAARPVLPGAPNP